MANSIITIDDLIWRDDHWFAERKRRTLYVYRNKTTLSSRLKFADSYVVKHDVTYFKDGSKKHSWSVISPKENIVFSHSIEKDGEENGFGDWDWWSLIHEAQKIAPGFI